MTIQAIETRYKGYRFRSRLEARWAVFFDALDEKYGYEIEGITGDGLSYLPDFWLPRWGCFVEVKGHLDIQGGRKFLMLVNHTGTPHIMVGDVGESIWIVGPDGPRPRIWAECPLCRSLCTQDNCACDGCGADPFWYVNCPTCSVGKVVKFKKSKGDPSGTPKILSAYTAARSARFEHGETPKVPRGKVRHKGPVL